MVKNLVTRMCKGKEIYKGMNPLIGNMDLFTSQVTLHAIGTCADGQKFEGDEEGHNAKENNVLGNFKITEIPEAPKGVPEITVSMTIDHKHRLTVTASTGMVRSDQQSAIPIIEKRMTKFDDGQNGWRDDELLIRTYGDTVDLVTLFNVKQ
ncbi:unnamed protein product [Trifolium pratense]|uniref:Uncharacterized protein n=1 Tax=Trifolium pratense TaxID=57577 RepID=A0ACB0JED0_TRIPR|nr:unnamed protein product [Trifolium pratense]